MTQTEYSIQTLMERPLPEGVDPTHIEDYLNETDFISTLGVCKEEFSKLPVWKQTAMKKEFGLF